MLEERDAARMWRDLFHGQEVTSHLLSKAELLVGELHSESPLRLRFATEIKELRNMERPSRSKKKG